MTRPAAIAVRAALVTLGACAATPGRPQFAEQDYPGTLRAPESLPIDVVWQQRVTAVWGEGQQRGFDAAIQKRDGALTVLGLSPMGSMGFAIVLRGASIDVQNNTQDELPFPPRFILLDVQRAFYPWLPAGGDGKHSATVDGEVVAETWAGGRLTERRFQRVDGAPAGDIVVRYEWLRADWRAPTRVVLDNGWFGYRLTVDTHAETLLVPDPGGP